MDNGIIRVGGRLAHGYSMTDDQRFPLLVSERSKLATLAINDVHMRTLHGGPTATVAEKRRQTWVFQVMKKASACIKKCVTCFRFNSGPTQQLMGDLPSSSIEAPERVFSCVGLEFAGPFTFKNGTECVKGYRAVLICFASKAVHLEAVSSLTSDAMVAALRQFIARRGIPVKLCPTMQPTSWVQGVTSTSWRKWSRQGHNHTTALNGSSFLLAHPISAEVWEAAVKSMKHHLRRVIGKSILTYEEMTTILCQIEQLLNNRPLMGLTNNPDDLFALTP